MIAKSPAVRYIHEPFNPDAFRPGVCAARFPREFTYVCAENAASYVDNLRRCFEMRYAFREGLAAVSTPAEALRAARDSARFAFSRWRGARPLVKDPHAIFSAEWLQGTFGMDVIVVIRHPAAFVGSLKKARWSFRFNQFLEQPLLMQHHLRRFQPEIADFARRTVSIVDQGILLWNAIYAVVLKYKSDHPEWIFVRHEDLSREPVSAFFDVFQRLRLEYPHSVRRAVADFSGPHNPAERHAGSNVRRDSVSNIRNWKKRLTVDEISRVKEGTMAIAGQLYEEAEW